MFLQNRSEHTLIRWNAQGKVVEVRKDQFGVSQTTKFWYNAAGNRVKKQVFNHMAPLENGADTSSVTYYVRDANEAVMAIYQQKVIHTSGMFGCLRKPSNNVGGDSDLDGVVDGGCDNCHPSMPGGLPGGEWNPWQEDYDRDGMGDACDPCPFQFTPPNAPCVGPPFLPEPEVWTGIAVTTTLAELPIYGSERLGLMRPNALRDTNFYPGAIFTRQLDKKAYELKDHLGNVRVVVSDLKGKEVTGIIARIKSVNSYYAFGMLEEGMSGSSGGYRYGYNGKEMDNELKGEGNSVDYGGRVADVRLGRWMSSDVLEQKYPEWSSYTMMLNNPVALNDPDGNDVYFDDKTGEYLGHDGGGSVGAKDGKGGEKGSDKVRIISKENFKHLTGDNEFFKAKIGNDGLVLDNGVERPKNLSEITRQLQGEASYYLGSSPSGRREGASKQVEQGIMMHFYKLSGNTTKGLFEGRIRINSDINALGQAESRGSGVRITVWRIGFNTRLVNAADYISLFVHEGKHKRDLLNGVWRMLERRATRAEVAALSWSNTSDQYKENTYYHYGRYTKVFSKSEQRMYFSKEVLEKYPSIDGCPSNEIGCE